MIFPTCFIAHSWYSLSDDVVFILNFQAFFIISQAYVNTYFVNLPYEVVTENKKNILHLTYGADWLLFDLHIHYSVYMQNSAFGYISFAQYHYFHCLLISRL